VEWLLGAGAALAAGGAFLEYRRAGDRLAWRWSYVAFAVALAAAVAERWADNEGGVPWLMVMLPLFFVGLALALVLPVGLGLALGTAAARRSDSPWRRGRPLVTYGVLVATVWLLYGAEVWPRRYSDEAMIVNFGATRPRFGGWSR
jgi:hypothetical protein